MIEITSAMVLAACDAYRKSARRKPVNGSYVEDMRNALEAALRAAPASPAERQGPGPGNTTEHLSESRASPRSGPLHRLAAISELTPKRSSTETEGH